MKIERKTRTTGKTTTYHATTKFRKQYSTFYHHIVPFLHAPTIKQLLTNKKRNSKKAARFGKQFNGQQL